MTTRADDCAEQPHLHVGLCQRTGYANGLADAAEVSESALAAVCWCHIIAPCAACEERVAAAILAATPTAAAVTDCAGYGGCVADDVEGCLSARCNAGERDV